MVGCVHLVEEPELVLTRAGCGARADQSPSWLWGPELVVGPRPRASCGAVLVVGPELVVVP